MDYNTNKIYIKNRSAFLSIAALLTLTFIVGLFMQIFSVGSEVKVIVSIILVIISFTYNLCLGIPGYIISIALNLMQIFIYFYRFYIQKETLYIYLLSLATMSIIIILAFNLFMRKVSDNIISLREKIDEEQSRRINSETTALIESTMIRPTLITKHVDVKDASDFAELIDNSRAAHIDSLTTLPGREKIFEHIDSLINSSITAINDSPIRIVYMAPDDPTSFLNNLGHRSTDLFIQCIAHRIRESADSTDLVGRISRLEFVIVTNRDISDDDYKSYIDGLIMAAEDSVMDSSGKSRLKYYAGCSIFPGSSRYSGDILHDAEIAARSLIVSNSDVRFAYASDRSVKYQLLTLPVNELKSILRNGLNNNEFYLVYQPQFDASRKIVGFEAFVRWNNPDYTDINPADFLIAAERTNLIYDIGMFVIKKALWMLSEINDLYPNLKMAINMSAFQLQRIKTVEDLTTLIDSLGINKNNVVVDIPEESLLTNINSSREVIEQLADSGVTMALDNFGRCYSSLNNIPLFPISIVKLDSNFTTELKEGSNSGILTSSIIDLLNEINVSVDATGVETPEQFEALKAYDCKYYQGRYLCDSLSEDKVMLYLKENI